MNGARKSFADAVLTGIDSLLILLSVWMGTYLRVGGFQFSIFAGEHALSKMILISLVVQLAFYYFDLYNPKMFRERKATGILILESLGLSAILLAVIYYLIPFLALGRGIFAVSLFLMLFATFGWRLCFASILRTRTFKERILIIGTGELARKIKKEVLDNGHDGFEIVGFIDESRDKIGQRV